MPNLCDSRRKAIQAKQRKAENTKKREGKIAKERAQRQEDHRGPLRLAKHRRRVHSHRRREPC